jgi:hypothetical protein
MLSSKIETDDTTGKGPEKRENLGVLGRAGRSDYRDDAQNEHDDKQAENRPDGGLQMPNTTFYISIPLATTARQPFRRDDLFFHEWK